ncbi:MAG: gfo/Idh/MocA family oxidoreductase, partial [Planctomycetia bacterium]
TWSGGSDQRHFDNFFVAVRNRNAADLHLDIEEGHLSSAMAHLGNVSWSLGTKASLGTRPRLASNEPRVAETFTAFEEHLRENAVDTGQTPFLLGRELSIDPVTERSDDAEANTLFGRDYRDGYELPRALR